MKKTLIIITLILGLFTRQGLRAQELFVFEDDSIPVEVENAYRSGMNFLAQNQRADGSWGTSQQAGITGLAILSILAHGEDPEFGPYRDTIRKALGSLITMQNNANGYIGTSMYNHGFATLALAEAYGTVQDDRIGPALQKAVELILSSQKQNAHNAWRYSPESRDADTTVSGAQIVALLAARNAGLEIPDTAIKKALQYIASCQRADGSIGYTGPGSASPPRSAIGALVFHLAREKENNAGKSAYLNLKQFENNINTGSYYYYYLYYASQAYFRNSVEDWERWNSANIKTLVSTQMSDGSWMGSHGPEFSTASSLLSLALNYRYLPIYER
jgi:hypothetical protein